MTELVFLAETTGTRLIAPDLSSLTGMGCMIGAHFSVHLLTHGTSIIMVIPNLRYILWPDAAWGQLRQA